MTYMEFIERQINGFANGVPIYTRKLAERLAEGFSLSEKDAAAAASVAVKRIMSSNSIPELRCFQKGIYYLAKKTPFGETDINKEALIMDKYLSGNNGYETGYTFLHRIGLTTQIPAERTFATNKAKGCVRADKALGVIACPPKVRITAQNKAYLQTLDVIELMGKAPVDAERPYQVIAEHIQRNKLEYGELLSLAGRHYTKNTVLTLAHIAGERII